MAVQSRVLCDRRSKRSRNVKACSSLGWSESLGPGKRLYGSLIFRVDKHRVEHGESARALLIDLAQDGDPRLKPMVAKVLAQLELLQCQSSYF